MLSWCKLKCLRSCVHGQLRWYGKRAMLENEYPKITVPHKMIEKLHKHNIQVAREKAINERHRRSTRVIDPKRKEYRFYKGQKYNAFDPKQLASHGWKHRNCGRDYFTICQHGSNPAMVDTLDAAPSFTDFNLDERIVNYLEGEEGIQTPTKIQSKMIPSILDGRNVICAAETGSGKTYAYLLPVIHNILRQKNAGIYKDSKNSPFCIIMVPSRELLYQVKGVCDKLCECVGLTSFMYDGSREKRNMLREDDGVDMDILIASSGGTKRLLTSGFVKRSSVTTVIVDEADTMLDDSFSKTTCHTLQSLQVGSSVPTDDAYISTGIQLALVSATFPTGLDRIVDGIIPIENMKIIKTDHLHHVMPHIPQKFIRTRPVHKYDLLVELLKKRKPTTVHMIFCNKTAASFWLSNSLRKSGIDNILLNGDVMHEQRQEILDSFLRGEHKIMVCTDVVSRGIDTQIVDHVVNFEFPSDTSDYIHRSGRVGRVGNKKIAMVTSFISHVWDVDILWKIETAVRKRAALSSVDANIKKKLKINSAEKKLKFNDMRNRRNKPDTNYSEDADKQDFED